MNYPNGTEVIAYPTMPEEDDVFHKSGCGPRITYSPTTKAVTVYYPGDYNWKDHMRADQDFDFVCDFAANRAQELTVKLRSS